MKTLEVIAAAIRRDGKYLIGKRLRKKDFGGLWEFPGGRLEEGETHEECLYREIEREEFPGMKIFVGNKFGESVYEKRGSDLRIRLHGYHAIYVSGEINPTEHEEIRWVYLHELGNYKFAPADVPLSRRLRKLKS